jgi:hypothetical protein
VATAAINRGIPQTPVWFEDPAHEPGTPVDGAFATQQRGYYSITTQIHTNGLTPGHQYTIWWVIYNDPAACVDGCDFEDLDSVLETGKNPAGIGVQYAGSFVGRENGKFESGTRILEHATAGCQTSAPFKSLCNPFDDASVAEAIVFIRDHGPATDEPLPAAKDLFSYGCKAYTRNGEAVVTYSETGYDCFNVQSWYLP